MRHRMAGRKLGRNGSHRRALYRNLVTSFLRHERIETTEAKGKEIRAIADRMISLGKKGDLHSRRRANAYLMSRGVVSALFSDIAPRFSGKNGGYTRLIKTRARYGDAAPMAILELTETESSASGTVEKEEKPTKEKGLKSTKKSKEAQDGKKEKTSKPKTESKKSKPSASKARQKKKKSDPEKKKVVPEI
ncbi:MAG: 50S ribosomal protein L17 [Nitrospiria bacterium]